MMFALFPIGRVRGCKGEQSPFSRFSFLPIE
jgi:hypothetical protein